MKIVNERIVAKRRPGAPGAGAFPVTVQQLAGDHCRWRVEFAEQGQYFREDEEMRRYLRERFGVIWR